MSNPTKRSCATMDHHHALSKIDEVYRDNRRQIEVFSSRARVARTEVLRIPVVVHVLYHRDIENISDAQIKSQIAVLNADFRMRNTDIDRVPAVFRERIGDARVEFALAVRDPNGNPTTGITRTFTSIKEFIAPIPPPADPTPQLDAQIKRSEHGKAAWPASDYLNLWVCNLGDSLLGYAQFPGGPAATDGVVIRYEAFGTIGAAAAPYNLGRTATHEIGHWLNLLHIWGDDGDGCNGSDNVSDTPNQAGSNGGKPTFPSPSCNNGPDGDMFMNFMDYVDDDTMQMFTKGQVRRMDATILGPRKSLAKSQALQSLTEPINLVDDVAPGNIHREIRKYVLDSVEGRQERVFDGVEWIGPE